jgi:ATP-binding cassette subfamily D (ALD) long-chain fatty acid import protein
MPTTFTHERAAALLAVSALVLRSRIVGAPRDALTRRPRTDASAEEVEQALRTGYLEQPDGSRVLLIPQGGRVAKVRAAYTVYDIQVHGRVQVHIHPSTAAEHGRDAPLFPPAPAAHKPALDREFVRQLAALVRVAIPGWTSREALLVALHSLFLVLRTVLSVGVAQLDGRIVRDLVDISNAYMLARLTVCFQVSANGRGFLKGLGLWFALAIPSIYTNAMARPAQPPALAGQPDAPSDPAPAVHARAPSAHAPHALHPRPLHRRRPAPALLPRRAPGHRPVPHLRRRRVHRRALRALVRARPCPPTPAERAHCSGNVMKPALDIVLFTSQLSRALGARGTLLMFLNVRPLYRISARGADGEWQYYATARILRAATPAFGRLAAVEARLEGEFRAGMGRVGRESEEIACVACDAQRVGGTGAEGAAGSTTAGRWSARSYSARTAA